MAASGHNVVRFASANGALRNLEPIMLVAGTFDVLHAGHFALLHTAFLYSKSVEIWVSNDNMTQMKAQKLNQMLQSFDIRCQELKSWIDSQTPSTIDQFLQSQKLPSLKVLREDLTQELHPYANKYTIHELWDSCGPAISNADYTAITCSPESISGCDYINAKRLEISHTSLTIYLSPLITGDDGQKVSSTSLRSKMQ